MSAIRQKDRTFGIMFAVVFAIIGVVAWLGFDTILVWAFASAGGFLAVALVAPGILLPLNRLWGVLAGKLGVFNNFLLLGAFFFLIILPAGMILRVLGRDPLRRTLDPSANSYWRPLGRAAAPDNYEDMF